MAKLRVNKIAAPIVKDEFTGSVYFDGTGDYLCWIMQAMLIGHLERVILLWKDGFIGNQWKWTTLRSRNGQ